MPTATKDRLPDMAVIFVQSNSSVMLLCCCYQVIMRGCLCVCVSETVVLLFDFVGIIDLFVCVSAFGLRFAWFIKLVLGFL